jgi:hypothetical protein
MYVGLVNAILFADFLIKFLIGLGLFTGAGAIASWIWWGCEHYGRGNIGKPIFFSVFFTVLCFGCIVTGNLNYFSPEYIVLRAAAPEVDKYIDKHPDAIYNPETALTMVNDTALGLVSSIKTLPDVIKKISAGVPIEQIRAEQEMAEFKAWKAAQQK